MILKSGRYEGKEIKDLSDVAYLTKLSKKTHDASGLRIVSHEIEAAARARLKELGYRFVGERVEYDPPERKRPVPYHLPVIAGWAGPDPTAGAGAEEKTAGIQETGPEENHGEETGMVEITKKVEEGKKERKRVICKVEECSRQALKDGLCYRHYKETHGEAAYPDLRKKAAEPKSEDAGPISAFAKGFGARVKAVRQLTGLYIRGFARKIIYDNSALGNIEAEGSKIKDSGKRNVVRKIIEAYPEISEAWLMKGEGEMIIAGADKVVTAAPKDETKGSVSETKGNRIETKFASMAQFEESEILTAKIKTAAAIYRVATSESLFPPARKVEEHYVLTDGPRSADIFFTANGGGIMEFAKCKTELMGPREEGGDATFDDWMFLGRVASQIAILAGRVSA